MSIHISYCLIGVFAYNNEKQLIEHILFKKEKSEIVRAMRKCASTEISPEEQKLLTRLNTKDVIFETPKKQYESKFPNIAGEALRENMHELAIKTNFAKSRSDFNSMLFDINYEMTAEVLRNSTTTDKLIIQAVSGIDETDSILNILSVRLREWYGYYFPEVSERIKDHEKFVKYVSEETYRKDVMGIKIEESLGSDIEKKDLDEIKKFGEKIKTLYEEREELEKYVENRMKEIAPNMSEIVGGVLGAKLIAHAGSMKKLASFPSSTIQLLGAEKALFRFLHGAGKSPKHGLIFQSSYIQQAPKERRGKAARLLASKLSLAAKMDFYKGKFIGDKLRADIERKIREMKKS